MKKTLILLGISVILFMICPWLTVLFGGQNGMAICLIQFFVVNPLFFIIEGIFSGFTLKQHWWLPLASAAIYLLSTWILLEMGESAFITYAVLYLLVGAVAMLGGHFGKNLHNTNDLL